MYGGVGRRKRRDRARQALDKVGLSERLFHRPSELSGGERQRVAGARALVNDPAILLADEPTANLDSKTGFSLIQMMKALNEEQGLTFIFSTHDPMIMGEAHRIVHLKDGKVIKDEKK